MHKFLPIIAIAILSSSSGLCLASPTQATRGVRCENGNHGSSSTNRRRGEEPLSSGQKQAALAELRAKELGLPMAGINVDLMKGSFYELRGGAMHGAVDILAPRNTPVLAVEDGKVAKLFTSKCGGLTIYELDPTGKYIYYYAHLEKYAENLRNDDPVQKGQIIGYVGTSGNAPPNTPHLHLSFGLMGSARKWWQTSSIDPYEVYRR